MTSIIQSSVEARPIFAPDSPLQWSNPSISGEVVLDEIVPPLAPWSALISAGDILTIVDVGGNQSADFIVYSAADTSIRYSVPHTLAMQNNVYLNTDSVLRSNLGSPLMTVMLNEIERQDTIGGACSKESNTLRYGHHTHNDHGCRENFIAEARKYGLSTRDLVSNVNWFMNVPVENDGSLGIVDGLSSPGRRVELRAEIDVLVIVSNCPQMNNPCNDFNCTPLRMIVTHPESE